MIKLLPITRHEMAITLGDGATVSCRLVIYHLLITMFDQYFINEKARDGWENERMLNVLNCPQTSVNHPRGSDNVSFDNWKSIIEQWEFSHPHTHVDEEWEKIVNCDDVSGSKEHKIMAQGHEKRLLLLLSCFCYSNLQTIQKFALKIGYRLSWLNKS